MNYEMDRVSIRMVKEPPLLSEKPITGPGSAIEILNDYLGDFDREVMAIVNLRTDGKSINMNIMSMGTINASLACPREALKASICRMLHHIILGPDDRFYSLREHCEFPVSETDYAANIEELSFSGRKHKVHMIASRHSG